MVYNWQRKTKKIGISLKNIMDNFEKIYDYNVIYMENHSLI